MFARIRHLSAAAILLSVASAFAETADVAERVDEWGDPARISAEGAASFTAESIAKALRYDLATMHAGQPKAPLDKYLETIATRVTEGYRYAGFPEAKASVERPGYRSTKLTVAIEEGPRFRCGDITMKNPGNLVPSQLIQWLTTKQPPADAILTGFEQTSDEHIACWADRNGNVVQLQKPIWQSGEWAHFNEACIDFLKSQVSRGLADLGYPWADFEIALPTDAELKTADLQITINDLGPAAIIGAVTIEGNDRDSTQEIIDYLKVPLGASMSESARSQVWYKLWMSGRYLRHDVELVPPQQRGGIVELHIKVKEYDKATALAKPLQPAEEALMKCRQWMLEAPHRGDDWIISISQPANSRLVVSPKYGALLFAAPKFPDGESCKFAAALTPVGLMYASSKSEKKLAVPAQSMRFVGSIGFAAADGDENDNRFRFQMGLGVSTKDADDGLSPVRLAVSVSPVAIISFAHEHDAKCEFADHVLTINSEGTTLQLEADTGKLIRISFKSEEEPRTTSEIRLQHEAYERELACADLALQHRVVSVENQFEANRPLSSCLSAMINDEVFKNIIAQNLGNQDRVAKFMKSEKVAFGAIKAGLLRPADDALVAYLANSKNESEDFAIPDADLTNLDLFNGFVAFGARFGLGSDDFFPRGSSPSQFLKYMAAGFLGEADENGPSSIVKLNDFGPLQHLVAASLLNFWYGEQRREHVAWIVDDGLRKLENSNFEAEVKSLVAPDRISGKCIAHLASVLREMDERDVAQLGELLFAERGQLLSDAAGWLREHKDTRIDLALTVVLDQLWTAGLKSVVEARLHALELEPEEPEPACAPPPEEVLPEEVL